jgi:glucosamine-6-phosphate deaminase
VKLSVFPSDRAAAAALAARIADALAANPRLVLGLPTGRTPIFLYRELARLCQRGAADFSQATTFNLDEFIGVAASDPGSYRAYMEQHLFQHINIASSRVQFLNGTAADLEAECLRYEKAIAEAGGIDLQILGIGTNGHIGFNEPGPWLHSRTHQVALKPETRRANAVLFAGDPDRVPRRALSMGMHGDNPPREAHRAARHRAEQVRLHRAPGQRSADHGSARVFSGASPGCRADGGRGCRRSARG